MSVVNKMLQDLEARQADGAKISADYQPPAKGFKWLWLMASVVIVLLLCASYWFFEPFTSPVEKPALLAETNQAAKPNPAKKIMQVTETPLPAVMEAQSGDESDTGQQAVKVSEQNLVVAAEQHDSELPQQVAEQPTETENTAPAKPEQATFQMTGSSQASQTASIKQQIKDALAGNNNALAMRLLNQLLEQEPDNIEALKKLAALLFANGNVLKATNLLQLSVQTNPDRGDIRLMLARLYVQQNNQQAALAVLKQDQPAHYVEIDYLAYRANLAQQLADYTGAKQDYTSLVQVDGNNARWWLGLAITEEKLGNGKAALASYYHAQNLGQLEPAVTEFISARIVVLAGNS